VLVGVFAAVLIVVLWWFLLFSGLNAKSTDVSDDISVAESDTARLEAELASLERQELRLPETQAELAALREQLASEPDLAEFIRAAEAIKEEAGVEWVTVAPSAPVQTGSVATISLNIEVEGEYDQVLSYLKALEALSRTVVTDGIVLTAVDGSTGSASGDDEVVASGPPRVHVALTARMFSLSALTTSGVTADAAATETGGE